ncbi:MAG: hypothetical protein JNJ83_16395 [Verrucomicrobiaceae bacterium]|nr:hypothetical protein [Verrucomicrobiaceae bacterium]
MWKQSEDAATDFSVMSRPGSSLWKLSFMLLAVMATALLLMWALSSWALTRSFDSVGRAVVLDDIDEYSVLYERDGLDAVKALFVAGEHEHDQLLRLLDAQGKVLLNVTPDGQSPFVWPDLSKKPLDPSGVVAWHREPEADGSTLTIGRKRLRDGGEIWFARTDRQDREAIAEVHRLILFAIVVTGLLLAGPLVWFASRVLKPVRTMITSAHQLKDEVNLAHRLPTTAAIPELNEFANAFNASLDRVQSLNDELEAANDQLAHELRTPLARIRGNIEGVMSQMSDPVLVQSAVHALEEIDRASSLIQTILTIRAGDARSMRLELKLESPLTLVTEICELYSASAEEKNVELELLFTGSDVQMLFDRQRIQQAVCNLLDNALAYTPSGGQIEVELEVDADSVTIHVRDSGPGLSDTDPQRIWRRFMRGSAASASTPGIGLGLSLVAAVANAHRGEAGAENRSEGGAHFWIKLPLPQHQ